MPSLKQEAAWRRNSTIRDLRMVYSRANFIFTGERVKAVQALVDEELGRLGAEPEGLRRERIFREIQQGPF